MNPIKVLVAGYRRPLIEALMRMNIPFAVWHDSKVKLLPGVSEFVCAPFSESKQQIARVLEPLQKRGAFTHVIAAVERSVYCASLARRVLGARMTRHSVILRCFDKLKMKQFLAQRSVPMTPFMHLKKDTETADALAKLGSPVVVKGRKSSGGRGIKVHTDAAKLRQDVSQRRIVEAYVRGDEVSVESFINHGQIQFTNITRYHQKGRINIVPAALDDDLARQILELNRKVIGDLKIPWGITHMEVYLTEGGILFGEIAVRPPGGYIMELLGEAYAFDAWHALICMETDQPFAFPAGQPLFAAAVLITPGEGVVTAIKGEQVVRSLRLKAKLGAQVAPRESVGSDSGVVFLVSPSMQALLEAVRFVDENLQIEVRREV